MRLYRNCYVSFIQSVKKREKKIHCKTKLFIAWEKKLWHLCCHHNRKTSCNYSSFDYCLSDFLVMLNVNKWTFLVDWCTCIAWATFKTFYFIIDNVCFINLIEIWNMFSLTQYRWDLCAYLHTVSYKFPTKLNEFWILWWMEFVYRQNMTCFPDKLGHFAEIMALKAWSNVIHFGIIS